MSDARERLDILLVKKGMFLSRQKARESIIHGDIFVNGVMIKKPGTVIKEDANVEFKGEVLPYVSRGGLKLEKAINSFNINLKDKICMDVGASTGGFTDCMLQNGAKKIFSIDVGSDQLDKRLREDKRVVCMEKTNIKDLTLQNLNGENVDFASIDVSFISLTKVISSVMNLLGDNGEVVALIKPQFEAGRGNVGKKGVVKDKSIHIKVINEILSFIKSLNLKVNNIDFSPIKGPEGNIEYLIHFGKNVYDNEEIKDEFIEKIVLESHGNL